MPESGDIVIWTYSWIIRNFGNAFYQMFSTNVSLPTLFTLFIVLFLIFYLNANFMNGAIDL